MMNKAYEMFQSPKGRLQTMNCSKPNAQQYPFQSPKGRLQTNGMFTNYVMINLFQSPKGRLQTMSFQMQEYYNTRFNPQRGGYKPTECLRTM